MANGQSMEIILMNMAEIIERRAIVSYRGNNLNEIIKDKIIERLRQKDIVFCAQDITNNIYIFKCGIRNNYDNIILYIVNLIIKEIPDKNNVEIGYKIKGAVQKQAQTILSQIKLEKSKK